MNVTVITSFPLTVVLRCTVYSYSLLQIVVMAIYSVVSVHQPRSVFDFPLSLLIGRWLLLDDDGQPEKFTKKYV